jgi:hypothetical protein
MHCIFNDWNCVVVKRSYPNGRLALQLIDEDDGSPVAVATVNIPDVPLGDNQVIIKDWSENEGIYDALYEAGIVSKVLDTAPTGFVYGLICNYTGD